jgi:hypothetical protein
VRGQEFWGITSPNDAHHLPQILPQELQLFGRCSDDFGEVFLRVRGFLHSSSSGRPGLADSPQGVADCSADRLDRIVFFRLEASFVLRTVRTCLSDNPPLPCGQSASARRTIRSVRRNLPSWIGSFASSLVHPRVLRGIIPRTCS